MGPRWREWWVYADIIAYLMLEYFRRDTYSMTYGHLLGPMYQSILLYRYTPTFRVRALDRYGLRASRRLYPSRVEQMKQPIFGMRC